ncbi:hypothetical protein [Natrarchaeobaculum sulfurireducens]|uniref:Uncharacterized protein n=1 Tax=Natrarchaeobaculum sulfurireducens TaxID=2044521 RepID=A0A346PMG2_9EURY|nr:hypothetical protein [Natrarchaeobaculum sulfurireducens]AXR80707.1 hypothetical protein AArcMg_0685 [Natrarchaeobaculum sulfurireducens]
MLRKITQYVPFTDARRERMFRVGLHKLADGCDALVLMEWPDKQATLHQAIWNSEIAGWELDNGKRIFPRGKGGDPKNYAGVDIVYAHSEAAGPVSTEASLIAGAEEQDLYKEVDENGDPVQQGVAADGGQPAEVDDHVPDFPVKGLEWDAVEFNLGDAVEYDPFPVREDDARQAAEWAELSAKDEGQALKYVAYGALGVVLIVAFFVILLWALNAVSSGDGGAIPMMTGVVGPAAKGLDPRGVAMQDLPVSNLTGAADGGDL